MVDVWLVFVSLYRSDRNGQLIAWKPCAIFVAYPDNEPRSDVLTLEANAWLTDMSTTNAYFLPMSTKPYRCVLSWCNEPNVHTTPPRPYRGVRRGTSTTATHVSTPTDRCAARTATPTLRERYIRKFGTPRRGS